MPTSFRILYMPVKFMSAKRQKLLFPKFEKASLTAWSLTYSGRKSVTKIGSFPFRRGSMFLETQNYLTSPSRR